VAESLSLMKGQPFEPALDNASEGKRLIYSNERPCPAKDGYGFFCPGVLIIF
jgi:hypothetical protein